MSIIEAIILGLVQGLTEFIPVSSSGHLILAREVFGIGSAEALGVDAVLQFATILAVIVYFSKDIVSLIKNKTYLVAVIVGTVPAVVVGVLLESRMETIFRSSYLVAWMLILGAIIMYLAEKYAKEDQVLTSKKGFIIGLFQSLALVPGISRSGATLSGGLFTGLNRVEATRFSFLLAIPIILGSGLKKLFELESGGTLSVFGWPLFLGSIIAFSSGMFAIHFLINYLKDHKLTIFIWYRVLLALLILAILN
jgi:undecaprenyl-diphosphatase